MHRKLFEIPFLGVPVYSYGLMMVVGFLTAVYVIRRLSRSFTPNQDLITNAALYSLIAGIAGARLFYVVHYWDNFRSNLLSVFAIWHGGLELLGGVLLAIAVIIFYTRYHKLPVRQYMDVLAIGLMAALALGRIGCFLNGCCFGMPTDLPWGVRFPYGSHSYISQIYPDLDRGRTEPYFELPDEYFGYNDEQGNWHPGLKPLEHLTPTQKENVTQGPYRARPVHPTQLYSSANGAILALLLFAFWRRYRDSSHSNSTRIGRPGCTFGLMLILYGVTRFFIEFVRDDNPFEYDHLTISQNISIGLIATGGLFMFVCSRLKAGGHYSKEARKND